MRYNIRMMALLLSILFLLGAFTACGSESMDSSADSSETDSAVQTEEAAAAESVFYYETGASKDSLTAGIPAGDAAAWELVSYSYGTYDYPLYEETLEISWWKPLDADLAELTTSYQKLEGWRYVEDTLNVEISWSAVTEEEADEQFSLMLSSGTYPDLIDGAEQRYTGGGDAAIEDGAVLALDSYLYDYMPFYTSYFENEEIRRQTMTENGQYAAVYAIRSEPAQVLLRGPLVRTDWLEACGFDYSADNPLLSAEDWYTVLTAFSVQYDALTCWDAAALTFSSAWGIDVSFTAVGDSDGAFRADGFYYDADGTVCTGLTADAFREYLETMALWYADGLLDPDSVTGADSSREAELFTADRLGLWQVSNLQTFLEAAGGESVQDLLLAVPYLQASDEAFVSAYDAGLVLDTQTTSISAACAEPELVCIFLDWFYTQAGSTHSTMGEEGITFLMTSSEEVEWTELVTDNPAGQSPDLVIRQYASRTASLYDARYDALGLTEWEAACSSTWMDSVPAESVRIPAEVLTAEEAAEQTELLEGIGTYAYSVCLQWVTGELALTDDSWEEYVSTCTSLGLDRVLELEETGVQRYNSR